MTRPAGGSRDIRTLSRLVEYVGELHAPGVEQKGLSPIWAEAEMLAHREGVGHGKRETVGVILEISDPDPRDSNYEGHSRRLVWQLLENVAAPGSGTFEVSGVQLKEVFTLLRDRGQTLHRAALWHSHHGEQAGPSTTDVELFPSWFASVGFIYHVPTLTTTAYEAT